MGFVDDIISVSGLAIIVAIVIIVLAALAGVSHEPITKKTILKLIGIIVFGFLLVTLLPPKLKSN